MSPSSTYLHVPSRDDPLILVHRLLVSFSLFLSTAVAQEPSPGLKILEDPTKSELVISIGPIDLPAGISHHDLKQLPVQLARFPISGILYGFRAELLDKDDRPVPMVILHHLNLIDPDRRELFLPISRRLAAASKETGEHSIPWLLFGVPFKKGDRFIYSTMLHNPTDTTYYGVSVNLRLKFKRATKLWPVFDVYPFQLDVKFPVGNKGFDLPPGKYEISYEARPAISGRILGIGGHLHDFAVGLRFEDVTANKILWDAKPSLDEHGRILAVPVGEFWKRLGVYIESGHVYRVTATYYNPTSDTIPEGGMGVVGGIFLPARGQVWPLADMKDPLYVADLNHALRLTGSHVEHEASNQEASGSVRRHHH